MQQTSRNNNVGPLLARTILLERSPPYDVAVSVKLTTFALRVCLSVQPSNRRGAWYSGKWRRSPSTHHHLNWSVGTDTSLLGAHSKQYYGNVKHSHNNNDHGT